jgi:hypothetical protein
MQKILILAPNPREDLKLSREIRDLEKAIDRAIRPDRFEVKIALAVRPEDLQELFLKHKPRIVHFCGHGAAAQGLVFVDDDAREQLVSTGAIVDLFRLSVSHVHCAVFNACNSDIQAAAIVQHIEYAIGMQREILDDAAYWFAVGFYRSLGFGETIERSYEWGCNAIELALPEHLKPVLRKRAMTGDRPSVPPSPDFVAAIAKEANLKRYQDQTRDTWDGFRRSPSPTQPLTQHEYRQRQVFVGKVQEFWIEGFLKRSLTGEAIELGLQPRPDAVQRSFAEIPSELDQSFEQLQETSLLEQIGQGKTLLILGEPGAGKTIALLKLAERLVAQSAQDLSQPMPVVLNLASWAARRQPIADWLIEELREKYQVPKKLSKPWIEQEQLILLLDGLDEVKADCRNECVRSLNQFIADHSVTEIVICSRVQDYEALSEKLKLRSAICLQPLTSDQVDRFLSTNETLAGLRSLLQQDAELEEFAQTPLILNIMSSAYADWSIEDLMQQFDSAENRYGHLFDTYVDRMLGRRSLPYPKDKTIRWLKWMAQQMVQRDQIVFLIEKMQPTWLATRTERITYRSSNFLSVGLIFGLSVGLIFVPIFMLSFGLSGLISGLSFGLISGLIVGLSGEQQIKLVEQLSWSWKKAKDGLSFGLSFGLIGGLILGPIGGLIGGLIGELILGLSFGLIGGLSVGLILGLIGGLIGGLEYTDLEHKTVSNQGIWNSAKNCMILGLSFGLISGLSFGLISGLSFGLIGEQQIKLVEQLSWSWKKAKDGLSFGLSFGLIGGLNYGGAACIRHFNLRLIFYRADRIPWNYARFLDFASDRLLLKKVGGGYLFYHRMLMEHLARQ